MDISIALPVDIWRSTTCGYTGVPSPPPVEIPEVPRGNNNNNNSGFIWKRLPHTMKKKYLEYKKDRAEKKEMKERQKAYENKLDRETKERNKRFKEGKETENNLRIEKEQIRLIKRKLLEFKDEDRRRDRNELKKLSLKSHLNRKESIVILKKKLKQLKKIKEKKLKIIECRLYKKKEEKRN